MTRRDLLQLPGALAAPSFPGVRYRDYSRCLPDYLRGLAAAAREVRLRELAKLKSVDAVMRRQKWARSTFWKLVGGEPERTPLEAKVTGEFARDGYRVEKVVYQSRPGLHVPALLYIPAGGRAPFPAVLFQMGHSLNGKAADTYQRCCQALAKLGFVALAFDPMGQGERVYYPDDSGTRTRLASADEEHTLPGRQMLLAGDTATRLQVWDAVRSLDYLAAHPLVDPKRIGATGQSGGGTLTMLLAAVDDRIAAAVVSSGNTENLACAGYDPPGSTDDAEQNFVNAGPAGFDRWDLLYPFAPKPLLIGVSDKDSFGTYSPRYLSDGWEEYGRLQSVYKVLGEADRLAWTDTPLPHGLSYDSRLSTYNWFRRWLRDDRSELKQEPVVTPEPDRALWVTGNGSVLKTFGGATPRSLVKGVTASGQAKLEELLQLERPRARSASVLRRVPSRGLDIEAIEVPSAEGVWLPAWLFVPQAADASKPVILAVESGGRNARWQEGELYQEMARRGYLVCAADLRGIGDLQPEAARGNPRYTHDHADEEAFAWASLILGRTLAGQRVTDLLALVSALRAHPAARGRKFRLAAQGRLTLPALFAAALDRGIDELYLAGPELSYANVMAAEEYGVPFASFVPGILRHTDLPEVAATVAPRPVILAGMRNAEGDPVDVTAVRAVYRNSNIQAVARAAWDFPSLTGGPA